MQLSFKTFYLSKEKPPSPYKIKDNKEFKEKFKYFKKLNKKFQNLFMPKDKFLAEKKEIRDVIINLINHKNLEEINEFVMNGFAFDRDLTKLLLSKLDKYDADKQLLPIHKKQPLSGILAQVFFCSSHFQIYCHKILESLNTHFPQEVLSVNMFDGFDDYSKSYNGVRLREIAHDKDNAIQAMHIHNLCINPEFSIPLFYHALQRAFHPENYEYISVEWGIGSVLKVLFPYVKHYLSNDDKQFLFEKVQSNRDRLFKNGASQDIKNVINDFHEIVLADIQCLDQVGYKENLLNKVKVIYGNQSSNSLQHRFLSLHIEENKFLTNHKILIENIKNIHKKLSGHENLLDNENIDKINKILGDTLPVTIHKYNQIDPNFRENIKNTEGKNAHQLFEESLTNILFTMKEVEFNLEQAKVNDLSLTNRKNRIK